MSDGILSIEENTISRTLNISKRKDNCNEINEASQQIYDKFQKEKGTKYSYEIYLFKWLKLDVCGTNDYSNILHHIYQNNIDTVIYDRQF